MEFLKLLAEAILTGMEILKLLAEAILTGTIILGSLGFQNLFDWLYEKYCSVFTIIVLELIWIYAIIIW